MSNSDDNLLDESSELLRLLSRGITTAITDDDGLDGGYGEYLLEEIQKWQVTYDAHQDDVALYQLIEELDEEAASGQSDVYARDLCGSASWMLRRLCDLIHNRDFEHEEISVVEFEAVGSVSKETKTTKTSWVPVMREVKTLNDLAGLAPFNVASALVHNDPIVTNAEAVNVAHYAAAFKKFFENKYPGEPIHCEYIRELFAAVDAWSEARQDSLIEMPPAWSWSGCKLWRPT